jgi:hypothetical protein
VIEDLNVHRIVHTSFPGRVAHLHRWRHHNTDTTMRPEKKTKTNIGVGIGIILQLAGFALSGVGETGAVVGLLLILIGLPVFIWGCMNYAEGKGHSKWVGLVGLAGCIGLIVLIVLPDQHKEAR